ncbi:MAG TPA: ATP-binding protein [Pirellulaceae bacterium]|nr:ATP-binding protein [Pirellulaceae bacterium]
MSYRSIKRVLGETRLELKTLFLFGLCMCLLIAAAFLLVERAVVQLVTQNTRDKARTLIATQLLKAHLENWVGDPSPGREAETAQLLELISNDLSQVNFPYAVLVEDPSRLRQQLVKTDEPDEEELRFIRELRQEVDATLASLRSPNDPAGDSVLAPGDRSPALFGPDQRLVPLFRERSSGDQDAYQYYMPIIFTPQCVDCHNDLQSGGASLEAAGRAAGDDALHVLRLSLPADRTRAAIHWTWAVLITLAILTVSAGVVTLYLIVRYVVVRPLKHLREVSDQIRNGKMETRAELHTGDEFEELASSFNRMLRHIADSQAELRRTNNDLDRKVDELAQLNLQLHDMNRLKSEFLANMSHELRTPLNSIIGFSEVLQHVEAMSEKQRRYATNIQKSGRMLLEMINDILDLAKIEAGRMEVNATEFRLDVIVLAHCDMVRSLSEEKNIDLSVEIDPQLPPILQDQTKIQQILNNLLSNAIKFTPEGGRIVVSARPLDDRTFELAVADTGVGIAEDDQQIIFEKFRQGRAVLGDDSLTREYSGTGLGLSIVRELCNLLGGEVTLQSEVGRGSTFRILLPTRYNARPRRESDLSNRLDDLSRGRRTDFQRRSDYPEIDGDPLPMGVS